MILSYHNVADQPGHYTVSQENLEKQLQHLLDYYEIVSLDMYVEFLLKNGKNNPHHAALTFDDAFVSFPERVALLLEKTNTPAALFIPTGFIGKSNEWDEPENRFSIISENELKELSENPLITLGAHAVSHSSLPLLKNDEIRKEIFESKNTLEILTGKPIEYLAYPHGQLHLDENTFVREVVREAGFRAALSTNFSISNKVENLFRLNRITVEGWYDLRAFQQRLKSVSSRYIKQRVKNIVSRLRRL